MSTLRFATKGEGARGRGFIQTLGVLLLWPCPVLSIWRLLMRPRLRMLEGREGMNRVLHACMHGGNWFAGWKVQIDLVCFGILLRAGLVGQR